MYCYKGSLDGEATLIPLGNMIECSNTTDGFLVHDLSLRVFKKTLEDEGFFNEATDVIEWRDYGKTTDVNKDCILQKVFTIEAARGVKNVDFIIKTIMIGTFSSQRYQVALNCTVAKVPSRKKRKGKV